MRSYASSQKHSSPSREAFAIPPLCWRCVQWDSSLRAENTAGWQRCRNRYQLVRLLDCARTAAIQPGLWRNQCGFSAGGRLAGFGCSLARRLALLHLLLLSGMLLLKLLRLLSVALLHRLFLRGRLAGVLAHVDLAKMLGETCRGLGLAEIPYFGSMRMSHPRRMSIGLSMRGRFAERGF
jgi:hypothetical protein